MLLERSCERIRQKPPRNRENKVHATFDALDEEDPLELWGLYGMGKLRWLGYNLVKIAL